MAHDPLDYMWFDADNHYYETDDAFTRFMEPKFADQAVHVRRNADGVGQLWFGDTPTRHQTKPPSDALSMPGSAGGAFEGGSSTAQMYATNKPTVGHVPEFEDRDPRLAVMDRFNLQAAVVYPTIGLAVEPEMRAQPEACMANIRSFNNWLADHWGFAYDNRIFASALMSLVDLDAAVAEVERVLGLGAKAIHITPGPVNGRSIGDPYFDPIWARIAEADAIVTFHVCNTGYLRIQGPPWGIQGDLPAREWTALARFLAFRDRPISDTIAAMILQNVFGRHPKLRVLSSENSAHWIPWTLGHMDRVHNAVGSYETFGGPQPTTRPSDVFREHVYVAPWSQEDIPALAELIGIEHVLFGSDFPHPEGLEAPKEIIAALAGLSDGDVRKVLRDNCKTLLGV